MIETQNEVKEKIYPVSEIFNSMQGEGVWAGTSMTFIRLAGCTVGKPYPKEMYDGDLRAEYTTKDGKIGKVYNGPNMGLPIYTEKCTLYDGRTFACDTDYRVKERLTVKQIINRIPADMVHVNITGGEPLMHNLNELMKELKEHEKEIHIETSGTKEVIDINGTNEDFDWVCVSPKFNCLLTSLQAADEIKLLVDETFNPELELMNCLLEDGKKTGVDILELAEKRVVFLQPVNDENTINVENLKLCLKWQQKYPQFRLSIQLHKVIEHFVGTHIR